MIELHDIRDTARRRSEAEPLWGEVAALRETWDVLRHPFYRRWSEGVLDPGELMLYAEEYHHAVVAIATASRRAAELSRGPLAQELEAHALEEEAHIKLWYGFAAGTGWCGGDAWFYSEEPLDGTVSCARVWAGDRSRSLAEHLVTLYAIESAQPRIAEIKLDGLLSHYAFRDGPTTEYFRVHAIGDQEHAALARVALNGVLAEEDRPALAHHAEAVYRSYWGLLDGLEEARLKRGWS